MKNPVIFSPKSAELCQEHEMTQYYFAEWTYPQSRFLVWGMASRQ